MTTKETNNIGNSDTNSNANAKIGSADNAAEIANADSPKIDGNVVSTSARTPQLLTSTEQEGQVQIRARRFFTTIDFLLIQFHVCPYNYLISIVPFIFPKDCSTEHGKTVL